MKLIPQNVVDEAADKFDHNVKLEDLLTTKIFKAGVEFAEKELEDLNVEFGEWLLDTLEVFDAWSRSKISTENCFQQFLKERNNEV